MKDCNVCDKTKQYSEFPARKSSKDGYRNTCKICCNIRQKDRRNGKKIARQYCDNAESKQCRKCLCILSRHMFNVNKNNRDGQTSYCRLCLRIKAINYRRSNVDKIKKYKHANRFKISISNKKWYLSGGREKVLENKRKRRERMAELDESYGVKEAKITMKEFRGKCFVCGSKDSLHIDHHRPLSKGHALSLNNAVVLCEYCNKSKGPKDPEKFYGIKICAKLDRKLNKIASKYKGEKVNGR